MSLDLLILWVFFKKKITLPNKVFLFFVIQYTINYYHSINKLLLNIYHRINKLLLNIYHRISTILKLTN
jgi:hypothetical protein